MAVTIHVSETASLSLATPTSHTNFVFPRIAALTFTVLTMDTYPWFVTGAGGAVQVVSSAEGAVAYDMDGAYTPAVPVSLAVYEPTFNIEGTAETVLPDTAAGSMSQTIYLEGEV